MAISEETKKDLIASFEKLGMKYGKDFTDETLEEMGNGKDEKKDKD